MLLTHLLLHTMHDDRRIFAAEPTEKRRDSHLRPTRASLADYKNINFNQTVKIPLLKHKKSLRNRSNSPVTCCRPWTMCTPSGSYWLLPEYSEGGGETVRSDASGDKRHCMYLLVWNVVIYFFHIYRLTYILIYCCFVNFAPFSFKSVFFSFSHTFK